jgi:hypothetical protein
MVESLWKMGENPQLKVQPPGIQNEPLAPELASTLLYSRICLDSFRQINFSKCEEQNLSATVKMTVSPDYICLKMVWSNKFKWGHEMLDITNFFKALLNL